MKNQYWEKKEYGR